MMKHIRNFIVDLMQETIQQKVSLNRALETRLHYCNGGFPVALLMG